MPAIRLLTFAEPSDARQLEIRQLLVDAFAGDFSDDDWEHTLGGRHVVVAEDETVLAHAAVVPRIIVIGEQSLRTGYVEGVATTPGRQRSGLGSLVLAEVSELVRRDFELGALSTSRLDFYAHLGWEQWQGPTFVRHDATLVRTEADDGGVMILRCDPSADVDLTDPISCEARAGDDW